MTTQFERLKAGFAITLGGQLMPGAGAYSIGAVAVVLCVFLCHLMQEIGTLEVHVQPLVGTNRIIHCWVRVGIGTVVLVLVMVFVLQ